MKIVIDLRPLMSGKVSGVEVYIQSMLKALFELDTSTQYILWVNSFKPVDTTHFPTNYPNVSLLRTRFPNKLFNLSLSLLRLPKIDWLIPGKVDFFWVPDIRPAPVSKLCKKIITVHDLSPLDFKKGFTFKTRLWHKILRLSSEFKEAYKLIAVSEFTKARLLHYFPFVSQKTETILEASSLRIPTKKPDLNSIQSKYKLPVDYILCLSTLEPRKNIEGLLKAYLIYHKNTKNPVDLVVAGKAYPSIFESMDLADHPNIRFIGFVDEVDKYALYHFAECFVYPSFYEGVGLPVLEAMSAGSPVITSKNSAMAEMTGDSAFLIDPYDLEAIAKALSELLSDSVMKSRLIDLALKGVHKLSWEASVTKFHSHLK